MTHAESESAAVEQAWFRLGDDGTIVTVASSFGDVADERAWLDLVGPHIAFPDASPHASPHALPHTSPHASPHATPHTSPHAPSDVSPHASPHAFPDAVPHASPHAPPASPHPSPHPSPQTFPGAVPYASPHAFPHAAASGPALSYLVFPHGLAAVLYRRREPGGDTLARALLGRATELTATVALSTSDWHGWVSTPAGAAPLGGAPASTRLAKLRVEEVVVPGAADRLRAWAIAQGDQLARVLAWLLQAPAASIGIVGCAEQDRVAQAFALTQIAAPVLPGRAWTFATHVDTATDGRTPAIAFFDTPPEDPAGRLVIDVRRGQGASPHNEYQANALVYRYEYGVDPPDATAAPAHLPVPPPVPRPHQPAPARQPHQPAMLPQWRATALVRDLAAARSATTVNGALVELEFAVAGIDDRDNVRRALANEGWAERAIGRHVPFDQREAVYVRLATIAFGATGPGRATPGSHADARRIVAGSQSPDLVRAVALISTDSEVVTLLAKRWLREHEPAAPDPMAGLGPFARFFRRLGLPLTPAAARVLMVLFVLLLGAGLGWWAGGELT